MIKHNIYNNYSELLEFLIAAGYGWQLYAENIKKQGWISTTQQETVDKMVKKLQQQRRKLLISESARKPVPKRDVSESSFRDYTVHCDEDDEDTRHGVTEYQGVAVSTTWHSNGNTTYHFGGPAGPVTYDKHGEEC